MGGSKPKQCYIFHIAPQDANSANQKRNHVEMENCSY